MRLFGMVLGGWLLIVGMACNKSTEMPEDGPFSDELFPLFPWTERDEASVTLTVPWIDNPGFIIDYIGDPPAPPTEARILFGRQPNTLETVAELSFEEQPATFKGLEAGHPYYFQTVYARPGYDERSSPLLMATPGPTPAVVTVDFMEPFLVESFRESPDGEYLVWENGRERDDLYLNRTGDRTNKRVGGRTYSYGWSADSRYLIYVSTTIENNRLYSTGLVRMDVETMETDTLIRNDNRLVHLHFLVADPEKPVGYFTQSGGETTRGIRYMAYNFETGAVRTLFEKQPTTDFEVYSVMAIHNGEFYGSGTEPDDESINLYAIDIKTGAVRPLVDRTIWQDLLSGVSADGRRLAFVSDRSGRPELWTYHLDTDRYQQVTQREQTFVRRFTTSSWVDNQTLRLSMSLNGEWKLYEVSWE